MLLRHACSSFVSQFFDLRFVHLDAQARAVRHLGRVAGDHRAALKHVGGEELGAVQGGRLVQTASPAEGQRRGQRDVRVGQPATEPEEPGVLDELDLPLGRTPARRSARP